MCFVLVCPIRWLWLSVYFTVNRIHLPHPIPSENSRESAQAVPVILYAIVYDLTAFFLPHCSDSAFPSFLSGTDTSSGDAERPFQECPSFTPTPNFHKLQNFRRCLQSVSQPRSVRNISNVLLLYQEHSGSEGALGPADPILSLLAR